MPYDERRTDAWEAAPGGPVLAVMTALVVVALPLSFLFFLLDQIAHAFARLSRIVRAHTDVHGGW